MSSSKDTQKSAEKKEEPVATETFEERLASFTKWPHSGSLHPLYMAAAGFTFDSDNDDEHPDRVTCNSCNWSTHTWEKGEDPRTGHLLTQPDCPFVKAYCTEAPFDFRIKEPIKEPINNTRLQCKRCKEVFESGNKLHAHVKQMKHFSTK